MIKKIANSKKKDLSLTIKLPRSVLKELCFQAKLNFREVDDELAVRLVRSFSWDIDMKSHDQLMRLIFCKELAYKSSQ
jgi:hypothetical protein